MQALAWHMRLCKIRAVDTIGGFRNRFSRNRNWKWRDTSTDQWMSKRTKRASADLCDSLLTSASSCFSCLFSWLSSTARQPSFDSRPDLECWAVQFVTKCLDAETGLDQCESHEIPHGDKPWLPLDPEARGYLHAVRSRIKLPNRSFGLAPEKPANK